MSSSLAGHCREAVTTWLGPAHFCLSVKEASNHSDLMELLRGLKQNLAHSRGFITAALIVINCLCG